MATPLITKVELQNAHLDADSIAKFVNGSETDVVVTRTGVEYPSAANIVKNVATNVIGALSISQGVYGTTAAGLAATTNGQFFSVVSASTSEYVILYLNVAGVAQERKRYPSYEAIQQILEVISDFGNDGTNTAFAFQDGMGFVMLKFLVDGAIDMINGKIERTDFNGLELSDQYGMLFSYFGVQNSMINGLPFAFDSNFMGIEVHDENGFIVAKATQSGAYWGRAAADNEVSTIAQAVAQLNHHRKSDIMGVINYGQSLSRGTASVPPISLTQLYSNVMLKGGLLARSTDGAYDASAFVPMVAGQWNNEGETPINAMLDGLSRRLVEKGYDHTQWVFCGHSPGRGGRSVAALSPVEMGGTDGTYEAMIQQIQDTYDLAKSQGKTYTVWAYHWAQGENDNSAGTGTSQYDYTERLAALFDRLTDDIMAITGQPWRPFLFISQMCAHRRYTQTNMRIGRAQWLSSLSRDDFSITAPNYIAVRASDNNHLLSDGTWLTGEYASRAMDWTMINRGKKWRPLEPVAVDWQPTYIDVKFHVPQGKLVLDDALATLTDNMGFDLWVNRTTPLNLITGVAVTDIDTVRISLSAEAPSDAFLSYALGRAGQVAGPIDGARGNLRDTMGDFDKATSPAGVEHSLHNACIAFEYNRKIGF